MHQLVVQSEIGRTRSASMRTASAVKSIEQIIVLRPSGTAGLCPSARGRHLGFLARLCRPPEVRTDLERWIESEPTGTYARRACFVSMADGNGQISRCLINDVLHRDGIVPAPLILPISTVITHNTHNRTDYDRGLERFSKPLMRHYAEHYRFGETVQAEDGVGYNFHFSP